MLAPETRRYLQVEVDRRRRLVLQHDQHGQDWRPPLGREQCLAYSHGTSQQCRLYAVPGTAFCVYHKDEQL
jgi:hypothetical protein